jgi:uncharacterized membrane protein YhhN
MGGLAIGPIFWALAALGSAAAVAYGVYFLKRPPSVVRALVKTLFMGATAAALISAHAPFPLIVAINCSALGDFFLAFKAKWTLPLGILSFLLAQLVYVVMFGAMWFFSGDNAPLWPRYAAMIAIGLFLLGFLIWFWRTDEFRRAPISSTLAVATLIALGVSSPVLIVSGLMYFNGEADSRPPLIAFAPLAGLVLATIVLAGWRRKLGAVALVAMIYAGDQHNGRRCGYHGWAGCHDRSSDFSRKRLVLQLFPFACRLARTALDGAGRVVDLCGGAGAYHRRRHCRCVGEVRNEEA